MPENPDKNLKEQETQSDSVAGSHPLYGKNAPVQKPSGRMENTEKAFSGENVRYITPEQMLGKQIKTNSDNLSLEDEKTDIDPSVQKSELQTEISDKEVVEDYALESHFDEENFSPETKNQNPIPLGEADLSEDELQQISKMLEEKPLTDEVISKEEIEKNKEQKSIDKIPFPSHLDTKMPNPTVPFPQRENPQQTDSFSKNDSSFETQNKTVQKRKSLQEILFDPDDQEVVWDEDIPKEDVPSKAFIQKKVTLDTNPTLSKGEEELFETNGSLDDQIERKNFHEEIQIAQEKKSLLGVDKEENIFADKEQMEIIPKKPNEDNLQNKLQDGENPTEKKEVPPPTEKDLDEVDQEPDFLTDKDREEMMSVVRSIQRKGKEVEKEGDIQTEELTSNSSSTDTYKQKPADENNSSEPFAKTRKVDLLAQISAEDQEPENIKTKKPILINMVVKVMEIMFKIDSFKQEHPEMITTFKKVWCYFVYILITCGVLSVLLMFYVTTSFPSFVKRYFAMQGIEAENFTISHFSSMQIEINNLKDKQNTFEIDRVVLNYTVADLVRMRIKEVVLDGLKVKITDDGNQVDLGNFYKSFTKTATGSFLKIETLVVPEGNITWQYKETTIPIVFSLEAQYKNGVMIAKMPFKTKPNALLEMQGKAEISGAVGLNWQVDLSEFRFKDKSFSMTSKMNLITTNGVLTSISGDALVKEGLKDISLRINLRGSLNSLKGTIEADLTQVVDEGRNTDSVIFDFAGLQILNGGHLIKSVEPIKLIINKMAYPNVKIKQGNILFDGEMLCEKISCSFSTTKKTPVILNEVEINSRGTFYTSNQKMEFDLNPPEKRNLVSFNGTKTSDFYLFVNNLAFKGTQTTTLEGVEGFFKDFIFEKEEEENVEAKQKLTLYDGKIKGIGYELTGFDAQIMNPFSVIPHGEVVVKKVVLQQEESLIKEPFSLNLTLMGDVSRAQLSLGDNLIKVQFEGQIDLATGQFKGDIVVPEFEINALSRPLSSITPLFPKGLSNYSGKLSLLGLINYQSSGLITGPLFVSFKEVAGDLGNYHFAGLNSVLTVVSLVPFITETEQEVFIEKADGPVPFQNIQAFFQLEDPYVYLNRAIIYVGGIPLSSDPVVIPFKNNNAIIYFQNKKAELKGLHRHLKLSYDLNITGTASLTLPLYLRDEGIQVQNGEVRFKENRISLTKGTPPDFFDGRTNLTLKTGLISLNSNFSSQETKIQVSFDNTDKGKRKYQKALELDLNEYLLPMPVMTIPQEISIRQKLLEQD